MESARVRLVGVTVNRELGASWGGESASLVITSVVLEDCNQSTTLVRLPRSWGLLKPSSDALAI